VPNELACPAVLSAGGLRATSLRGDVLIAASAPACKSILGLVFALAQVLFWAWQSLDDLCHEGSGLTKLSVSRPYRRLRGVGEESGELAERRQTAQGCGTLSSRHRVAARRAGAAVMSRTAARLSHPHRVTCLSCSANTSCLQSVQKQINVRFRPCGRTLLTKRDLSIVDLLCTTGRNFGLTPKYSVFACRREENLHSSRRIIMNVFTNCCLLSESFKAHLGNSSLLKFFDAFALATKNCGWGRGTSTLRGDGSS